MKNKLLTRVPGQLAFWLATILVALASAGAETNRTHIPDREHVWRSPLRPEDYMKTINAVEKLQKAKQPGPLSGARAACGPWVSIGPIGFNGRVRSIQTRPNGAGYFLYIGASSGGIWRRSVPSTAWTSLGDNLPNPSVAAFTIHPSNPDDILVGTGDHYRYSGGGMFHTTNAGATWMQVTLPVSPGAFFRIYYPDLNNVNFILAASDQGLLRTTTGPNGTWSVVLSGLITDLAVHPQNPNVQYCCRYGAGVYRTGDGGGSWVLKSGSTVPAAQFGLARVAICRDSPTNVVFCYSPDIYEISGVRKSTNDGVTWTDITGDIGAPAWGQAFNNMALAFRPNNPNEIYLGGGGISVVNTAVTTHWTAWDPSRVDQIGHADQQQLYFGPGSGDDVLWICNDGGVWEHQIGGITESWNGDAATGLVIGQINGEGLDASRSIRVIGLQDNGVAGTTDAGAHWQSFSCCDGGGMAITDDINPAFWLCFGEPFRAVRQPFGSAGQDESDVSEHYEVFYDRFSDRVFSVDLFGSRLVSHAADGKHGWTVETTLPGGLSYPKLTGSYLDGSTLYLANLVTGGSITVLRKSGSNWGQTSHQINSTDSLINRIIVSRQRTGECWAVFYTFPQGGKIFHTTDDWNTFTDISGNLANINVGSLSALAVNPLDSSRLFLGTDVGVFDTEDGGITWMPFQTGLPIVSVGDLRYVVDSTGSAGFDKLVASTYGRGTYERCIATAPLLTITRTTTNTVAISWPSPSTGFTLQQNTNGIALVNWSNVTVTPLDDGTTKTLIVNPPAGNRFYRLKQ